MLIYVVDIKLFKTFSFSFSETGKGIARLCSKNIFAEMSFA